MSGASTDCDVWSEFVELDGNARARRMTPPLRQSINLRFFRREEPALEVAWDEPVTYAGDGRRKESDRPAGAFINALA